MGYVSLGILLGMCSMAHGISAGTFLLQASILVSGVLTDLPTTFHMLRYCSILPDSVGLGGIFLASSDTYNCMNDADTQTEASQCDVNIDSTIKQYERRGFSFASYNNESPDNILTETFALVAFSDILHAILFLRCYLLSAR